MKKHVVVRLTVVIGAVSVICMVMLFLALDYYSTSKIKEKAVGDMSVIANDRAELVETYIQGCCNFIDVYSHSTEVRVALENPKDADALKAIREITTQMAEHQDSIEGLYVAQWDTYVLAHINPDSMDKTFREPDEAKELEKRIRKVDAPFCTGIVQAPVTKKMVIPVYAPVKNTRGEMIGFVGAAFYTDGLSKRLNSLERQGKTGVDYSLINIVTNTYIFDNDESLVGTECKDDDILDAVKKASEDLDYGGDYSYSNSSEVVSCHYMQNRNWVFAIRDRKHEVFGVIGTVRTILIAAGVLAVLVMIVVVMLSIKAVMRPLRAISREVERLKEGDFSHGHKIEKYMKREDEFGRVAQAVYELNDIMANQNEMFYEIMKAQPAGTIAMRLDDNEILMINERALEMVNLAGYKGTVTAMDIRNEFDDENVAIVDENIAKLREKEGAIVTYEVSISNGVVTRRIFTSAKHVLLSNNDHVAILSMTDLTALEEREEVSENEDW
ncbi:MAG: hypothetical protein VZQ83_00150 [Eubacterium sp.]|nr:hypothetical protein [Eubacterium sp.]